MDLLACAECGRRFYAPGLGSSESRCCSQCGGGLSLALHDIASIPLDARCLGARAAPGAARAATAGVESDRIPSRGLA